MDKSPAIERAVRIELLRARAALERESLAHDIAVTTRSLSPGNLVRRWMPSVGRGNVTGLLWQGVSLARRYPVISSTLSAFLMKRGKKLGMLKLAGGALLGWQAFKVWRNASDPQARDR
jgi:hypothetical protein